MQNEISVPDTFKKSQQASKNVVPRIIWMLWLQGFTNAPELVKACVQSWCRLNPDHVVHLLDTQSLQKFIPAADLARIFATEKQPEAISNEIRLELLARHGGVWVDATTICARPLDDWLPAHAPLGFFGFARPGPDRMLSTWFLAASPANLIIETWRQATIVYWHGRSERHIYFWVHALFEKCYAENSAFRNIWDSTPKISAMHRFHFSPDSTQLHDPVSDDDRRSMQNPQIPVFKLTNKIEVSQDSGSLMQTLLSFAKGENLSA